MSWCHAEFVVVIWIAVVSLKILEEDIIASHRPLRVTANAVSGFDQGFAPSGNVATGEGGGTASPNTTVTNGSGTYTYSWAVVSTASGNTPSISSSTAQNPSWNTAVADGTPSDSTWRVTVTDSGTGATAQTDINVLLVWTNLS